MREDKNIIDRCRSVLENIDEKRSSITQQRAKALSKIFGKGHDSAGYKYEGSYASDNKDDPKFLSAEDKFIGAVGNFLTTGKVAGVDNSLRFLTYPASKADKLSSLRVQLAIAVSGGRGEDRFKPLINKADDVLAEYRSKNKEPLKSKDEDEAPRPRAYGYSG